MMRFSVGTGVNNHCPAQLAPAPVPGLFFQECGPIERNAVMAGQSGPTFAVTATSLALIFCKPEEA